MYICITIISNEWLNVIDGLLINSLHYLNCKSIGISLIYFVISSPSKIDLARLDLFLEYIWYGLANNKHLCLRLTYLINEVYLNVWAKCR